MEPTATRYKPFDGSDCTHRAAIEHLRTARDLLKKDRNSNEKETGMERIASNIYSNLSSWLKVHCATHAVATQSMWKGSYRGQLAKTSAPIVVATLATAPISKPLPTLVREAFRWQSFELDFQPTSRRESTGGCKLG